MKPLLSLRDALAKSGDDDADQANIQLKIVTAWIKWAEDDHSAALQEMKTAAAMEDATEKPPVSPGSIAPAPEMLEDMLLLAKQPKLALEAYEWALKSTPGRLRAEYGAAVSAQDAGLRPAAEQHYRRLLINCSHANSDLPELVRANHFFGKDRLRLRFNLDNGFRKHGTSACNRLTRFGAPAGWRPARDLERQTESVAVDTNRQSEFRAMAVLETCIVLLALTEDYGQTVQRTLADLRGAIRVDEWICNHALVEGPAKDRGSEPCFLLSISRTEVTSISRSLFVNKWFIGGERGRPDPEIREGVEIFLVSAGDGIFLSALDSQAVSSRRKRPDFFYQQDVYEHRSVNANESVGLERFRHDRNRLT